MLTFLHKIQVIWYDYANLKSTDCNEHKRLVEITILMLCINSYVASFFPREDNAKVFVIRIGT